MVNYENVLITVKVIDNKANEKSVFKQYDNLNHSFFFENPRF